MSPVHWPNLTAAEAAEEWPALRAWVGRLRERYPAFPTLPGCWWRHPEFVEMLAALRDHERASFTRGAPGTAAMEWQHARRACEQQLEVWVRRVPCAVRGRGHVPAALAASDGDGWEEHVRADVAARERRT